MEEDREYLKNEFIKIKNPMEKVKSVKNYKGDLTNYDWLRQSDNFQQLLLNLNNFNIVPTYIYSTKWSSKTAYFVDKVLYDDDFESKVNHHAFVLLTSNPNLIWQRTDVNQPGLSYNWIYYKDKKMKLTDFFKMSNEAIHDLLSN